MKLVRYGAPGKEKPGIVGEQGDIRDLSDKVKDIDGAFLAQGLESLADLQVDALPRVEGNPRLGPCVANVGKIVCVGLNYSDHAEESGAATPTEPILFLKPSSSLCGPNDNVEIPIN